MTLENLAHGIKSLLEDNGNLHEVLYVQGDLGSYADIQIKKPERIDDNTVSTSLTIDGQPFTLTLKDFKK